MLGQAALGRLFYYLTLDKVKSCGILGVRKFVEGLAMQYKKVVEVDTNTYASICALKCPSCGETYLHQGTIEAYNRGEDADTVRCVIVDGSSVFSEQIPSEHSNNPSSRRQGCIIHFDCEHCQGIDFKLTIAQHKGTTLLEWIYDDGENT